MVPLASVLAMQQVAVASQQSQATKTGGGGGGGGGRVGGSESGGGEAGKNDATSVVLQIDGLPPPSSTSRQLQSMPTHSYIHRESSSGGCVSGGCGLSGRGLDPGDVGGTPVLTSGSLPTTSACKKKSSQAGASPWSVGQVATTAAETKEAGQSGRSPGGGHSSAGWLRGEGGRGEEGAL